MSDMITNQRDFMFMGNQTTTVFNPEQMELYWSLIQEEVDELRDTNSHEERIKEACDVIVVTLGLLLSMGIDVHKAWELVHKNNMSKVSNQDIIIKDDNGKILKSEASKLAKQKMMSEIAALLK